MHKISSLTGRDCVALESACNKCTLTHIEFMPLVSTIDIYDYDFGGIIIAYKLKTKEKPDMLNLNNKRIKFISQWKYHIPRMGGR